MKKNMNNLIKKVLGIFSAAFIFQFSSCNNLLNGNLFDGTDSQKSPAAKTYSVTGMIDMSGAVPREMAEAIKNFSSDKGSEKTAFPLTPAIGDVAFSATAYEMTTDAEGHDVRSSTGNKTGQVSHSSQTPSFDDIVYKVEGLVTNKKYQIEIKIYKKNSPDSVYYTGDTGTDYIMLTDAVSVYSKDVSVKATQSGTGTISLPVKIENGCGITKCIAKPVSETGGKEYIFDNNAISFTGSGDNGICNSGSTAFEFSFYNAIDELLYHCVEVVNVFDNMVTDTWITNPANFSNPDATQDRHFEKIEPNAFYTLYITANLIKDFESTVLYVKPYLIDNPPASGFYNGTIDYPYADLKNAIDRVIQYGSPEKMYRIYVKDDYEILQEEQFIKYFEDAITIGDSSDTTKNRHITIECYRNTPGDGLGKGKITTNDNVLKVTGDGEPIPTKAGVPLFNVCTGSTLIVRGIDFEMKPKQRLCEVNGTASFERGSLTYATAPYRGPIFVSETGTLSLSDFDISSCKVYDDTSINREKESGSLPDFIGGGAIYSAGSLTIDRVSISDCMANLSDSADENDIAYGGAIYIGGGTCKINSISIKGCYATKMNSGKCYGGAIAVRNGTLLLGDGFYTGDNYDVVIGSEEKPNVANNSGGGLYVNNVDNESKIKISINRDTVIGDPGANLSDFANRINISYEYGAGICIDSTGSSVSEYSVNINGALICNNSHSSNFIYGAGIAIKGLATVTMNEVTVKNNYCAAGYGVGIYFDSSKMMTMNNCKVFGNSYLDSVNTNGVGMFVNSLREVGISGTTWFSEDNDVCLYGSANIGKIQVLSKNLSPENQNDEPQEKTASISLRSSASDITLGQTAIFTPSSHTDYLSDNFDRLKVPSNGTSIGDNGKVIKFVSLTDTVSHDINADFLSNGDAENTVLCIQGNFLINVAVDDLKIKEIKCDSDVPATIKYNANGGDMFTISGKPVKFKNIKLELWNNQQCRAFNLKDDASLTLDNCRIEGFHKELYSGEYNGGAIYSENSNLTIQGGTVFNGCTIENGTFDDIYKGGAVCFIGYSNDRTKYKLTIDDAVFESCKISDNGGCSYGGALYVKDATCDIKKAIFTGNEIDATFTASNSYVKDSDGAGIYADSAILNLGDDVATTYSECGAGSSTEKYPDVIIGTGHYNNINYSSPNRIISKFRGYGAGVYAFSSQVKILSDVCIGRYDVSECASYDSVNPFAGNYINVTSYSDDGWECCSGAGLFISLSAIEMKGCSIKYNLLCGSSYESSGGGLSINSDKTGNKYENVDVSYNSIYSTGNDKLSEGAGMYFIRDDGNPVFDNIKFTNNCINYSGDRSLAIGVGLCDEQNVVFKNVLFENNLVNSDNSMNNDIGILYRYNVGYPVITLAKDFTLPENKTLSFKYYRYFNKNLKPIVSGTTPLLSNESGVAQGSDDDKVSLYKDRFTVSDDADNTYTINESGILISD